MTLDQARHFDEAHRGADDPWGVTSRWYEVRKRRILVAALPDERYTSTLELGCSIGVLTGALADRSDAVTAVDLSEAAVARARERLADRTNVRIEQADIAAGLPAGGYDLVVLSEVGYYLTEDELDEVTRGILRSFTDGGTLVACHWRHPEGDFRQSGDAVHARLAAEPSWSNVVHHVEDDFVLDVLSTDPRSVAARTGLR